MLIYACMFSLSFRAHIDMMNITDWILPLDGGDAPFHRQSKFLQCSCGLFSAASLDSSVRSPLLPGVGDLGSAPGEGTAQHDVT